MSLYGDWDTLSIDQYKTVDSIKKQLRKGNWKYIREHPEIRAIIRVLLHHLINKKPSNTYEFAAQLFNLNTNPMLTYLINSQLKLVNELLRKSEYGEYDGELLFGETESTHSLVSKSSMMESMNSLLSYGCVIRERGSNRKDSDRESDRGDRDSHKSERDSRKSEKESRRSEKERGSRKSEKERLSRK